MTQDGVHKSQFLKRTESRSGEWNQCRCGGGGGGGGGERGVGGVEGVRKVDQIKKIKKVYFYQYFLQVPGETSKRRNLCRFEVNAEFRDACMLAGQSYRRQRNQWKFKLMLPFGHRHRYWVDQPW